MDATSTPEETVTCDGCGETVPVSLATYLEGDLGSGWLCTEQCDEPLPANLDGIAVPF
jgi:hypothetical protein